MRLGFKGHGIRPFTDVDGRSDLQSVEIEFHDFVGAAGRDEALAEVRRERHVVNSGGVWNVSDLFSGCSIHDDHVCAARDEKAVTGRLEGASISATIPVPYDALL